MSDATSDLLDVFFAAIERGDISAVDPLYADDVEVWHNVTDTALDKAASLALLRYWSTSVTNMDYEVLERKTYEGGAVQRHIIHGDAKGTALHAPVCIVFHIDRGQITRIYEYLDPAAVSAVFGAANRPAETG
jgi:ketosteroid isomerase-like protein